MIQNAGRSFERRLASRLLYTASSTSRAILVKEGAKVKVTRSSDGQTPHPGPSGSAMDPARRRQHGARRLTGAFLEPARPDWPPAGGLAAFQCFKGGAFHIWPLKPGDSGAAS